MLRESVSAMTGWGVEQLESSVKVGRNAAQPPPPTRPDRRTMTQPVSTRSTCLAYRVFKGEMNVCCTFQKLNKQLSKSFANDAVFHLKRIFNPVLLQKQRKT